MAAALSAGGTSELMGSAFVEAGAVTRARFSGYFAILRMPGFLPNWTFPLVPPIVGV